LRQAGRQAAWLLAGLTALRLLVAAVTPLSPDEAYYWVWSRALAPGYLDHPPMVALWIWAGTAVAGDGPLGVRLLAPLAAALGSVLLAAAGEDLFPGRRAGIVAAALLNATLLFGVGSVTMTPDTPLLLFWTATLWALARLLRTGNGAWLVIGGAAAGLALDSKYTAALLAPAVVLWLLASPRLRHWLWNWQAAFGLVVAARLFLPVFDWNRAHGWASFVKQGGRTGDWRTADMAQHVGELVAGQIGFATPLLAVLFASGVWLVARAAWRGDEAAALLAWLTLLPAAVFLQHALGDRVQANWPSVIYPAAALAAAGWAAGWVRWQRPATALGLAVTALVWVQAASGALPLPRILDPTLMRVGGWQELARAVDQVATQDDAQFVASDNYGHAALLARLLPASLPVLGVDTRWALFDLPDARPQIAGRHGLLLRSSRRADPPGGADWSQMTPVATLARSRSGVVAETYRLYRVTGRAGSEPIVALPRPR